MIEKNSFQKILLKYNHKLYKKVHFRQIIDDVFHKNNVEFQTKIFTLF